MARIIHLLKSYWTSRDVKGQRHRDAHVPERVAAHGVIGLVQDDWKVAAFLVATLTLATWGPALEGDAWLPLAAALQVLAERGGPVNLLAWQVLYLIVLVARIAGKLELRLRLGPKRDFENEPVIRNLAYMALLGLGWALVAVVDVHDPSSRWDRLFQNPISASLFLSVLGYLTAEWGSGSLAKVVTAASLLAGRKGARP